MWFLAIAFNSPFLISHFQMLPRQDQRRHIFLQCKQPHAISVQPYLLGHFRSKFSIESLDLSPVFWKKKKKKKKGMEPAVM